MRKYIVGFVVGMAIGTAAPLAAAAVIQGNGYLSGWTVTKGGREVCYMPYVWASLREIDCD